MYLWNTKALAGELKDGTLGQRERFEYLLLFVTLTVIAMESGRYSSEQPSLLMWVDSALAIVITVAGTWLCYQANRKGDDREFIDRYICMAFPIAIRLLVLLFGIFNAYLLVGYSVGGDRFEEFTETTSWVDVAMITAFELVFYWRLYRWIQWVAQTRSEA